MIIEDLALNKKISSLSTAGQHTLPGFLLLIIQFLTGIRNQASKPAGVRIGFCGDRQFSLYLGTDKLGEQFQIHFKRCNMTLATIAYRISTDVSFAAMLRKNTEETLHQAGIVLKMDEKTALQKILALPGQISRTGNYALTAEPWAAEK